MNHEYILKLLNSDSKLSEFRYSLDKEKLNNLESFIIKKNSVNNKILDNLKQFKSMYVILYTNSLFNSDAMISNVYYFSNVNVKEDEKNIYLKIKINNSNDFKDFSNELWDYNSYKIIEQIFNSTIKQLDIISKDYIHKILPINDIISKTDIVNKINEVMEL